MTSLLKMGYSPRTFTEVATHDHRATPEFAITFDDAFESVFRLGRPVLERLGVPATVFVCTDFVSSQDPMAWRAISSWAEKQRPSDLRSMSWDQLREVQQIGWEVGSHTCSHPLLTDLDDDELRRELVDSKAVCEDRLGTPCTSFAYPQSNFDERVVSFVESAGYTAACTLPAKFTVPTPYAWPRVGVYEIDRPFRFRLKCSRTLRHLRTSRLGAVEHWLRKPR